MPRILSAAVAIRSLLANAYNMQKAQAIAKARDSFESCLDALQQTPATTRACFEVLQKDCGSTVSLPEHDLKELANEVCIQYTQSDNEKRACG